MKYFLIAGEASGDLHAAGLIESIRRRDPEAKFQFLGGDLMAEAAGCQPIIHYRHMAYMGFSAVIRHLRKILGNLSAAKKAIAAYRPDAVILIDADSGLLLYFSEDMGMERTPRKGHKEIRTARTGHIPV